MKKMLHGFKYETQKEKIKWMLSLPLAKRYEMNLHFSEFLRIARKNRNYFNDHSAFKTIQVLKQK